VETLRALAMSGLLDRTPCNAVFVGARWVGSDDIGLAFTPLGKHFGSRLTLHNFEAAAGQCEQQAADIAQRPGEMSVCNEVCHGVAINEFVCNAAVAAEGAEPRCAAGTVPFYVQHEAVCSSLLKANTAAMERHGLNTEDFRCGETVEVLAMETSTIDASGFAPKSVDYVKLDVQGADLAVLRGGRKALADVSFAQIEVEFIELYEGQPLFWEVDRYAREELGLTFMGFIDGSIHPRAPKRLSYKLPGSSNVLLHADAIYIREPLPLVPSSGGRVADPAAYPYEVALRDRIVKVAALASAHAYHSITVELLDWMLRWSAAPACVRVRAAVAIVLVPAAYDDVAFAATKEGLGPSYAEAAALIAAATPEGTVKSATALCLRRSNPATVVATIQVTHHWQEYVVQPVVELLRGVAPRARAAEFCTRYAVDMWDDCVDRIGAHLVEARDAASREL
jgi:FkbM family methyltransferase